MAWQDRGKWRTRQVRVRCAAWPQSKPRARRSFKEYLRDVHNRNHALGFGPMKHNTDTTKRRSRRQRIPEERRKQIAEQIRKLRRTHDLTQVDLAEKAGIDPASLNQIEQAKRLPDTATILSLAQHLGVPASAIIDPAARTESNARVEYPSLSAIQATIRAELADFFAPLVTAVAA
jgi:transcriptional regulator with XRE-family HTH domain